MVVRAPCSTKSPSKGMVFLRENLSFKNFQDDKFCFWQVLRRLEKVSRHWHLKSLLVPPLTFRLLTCSRKSFSLPLVCIGISGRSNTRSRDDLFRFKRAIKKLIMLLFVSKKNDRPISDKASALHEALNY